MSDPSPPPPAPSRGTAPPGYAADGAQPAPSQPVRGLGEAVAILQGLGLAAAVALLVGVRQVTDLDARLIGDA